jgi:hypothetical protein
MLRTLPFAVAVFGVLAAPVTAQDGMPALAGMAVAQAPEAGLGVCFALTPEEGMECAQHECMEQSGLGEEDCAVNLWCYPHGWAAQVAVLHVEGIHWSKFFCDEMNRETLDAAIARYCDDEMYAECTPMRIWDRGGNTVLDYGSQ